MAQRKPSIPTTPVVTMLSIAKDDFKNQISERITIGEEFHAKNIATREELETLESEYEIWNEYNKELLKSVFNKPDNEYRRTYADAGYSMFSGQLGEVPNNPLLTFKNLLDYKLKSLKTLLAKADLLRSEIAYTSIKTHNTNPIDKTEVFIVHGHDNEAKQKTARFIEKLGFKPIILHEQISSGKTIIEKIEEYTNVGFGIILYTQCDVGAKKGDEQNMRTRARQNVVFEHGYLIGKIGRGNVCALVKGDVETPNDISGVVFVTMDDDDAWHIKIARELRGSGYAVDMNRL